MKNAIIKFLLQRRFLWKVELRPNDVTGLGRKTFKHLLFQQEYYTPFTGLSLDDLIQELTKDL